MTTPKKQLEILTFEKNNVEVSVKINYLSKTISLVETTKNQLPSANETRQGKNYLFSGREVVYMDKWLKILDAMSYAIKEAKKLLEEEIEKESKKLDNSVIVGEMHWKKRSELEIKKWSDSEKKNKKS